MTARILDDITTAFVVTLDGAYATLSRYSLGLLGILGTIYLLLIIARLMTGHASLGETLAGFLWAAIRAGVMVFLVTVLYSLMWNGAFMTFLQWGLEAGGGGFTLDSFLHPSSVLDTGFRAAVPMKDAVDGFLGLGLAWNFPNAAIYLAAYWITIFAFGTMALAAMATIIEMKLAIATAAVLVPWAVLGQTAVLGELSLSWLVAGLVRVLLTAALMSIGVPLFSLLAFPGGSPLFGGPDPRIYQAIVCAVGAVIFAALAWVLPSRAASIGGRGMALAIGGDVFIGGGLAGVSMVRSAYHTGSAVVRGVSSMLRR
jgi:type IV secretory pathway TrbL component